MISLALDDSRLARAYDELSDSQFESGRKLVEKLGVASGDAVLDIGCGTGRLAQHVLEKVGPEGKLIGLDPLPDRIAIAKQRLARPNAEFHVGVAEDLGAVQSGSVEVACLSAVFHWVEDKKRALREIQRVLRAGGRIGLTTNAKELGAAMTIRSVTAGVLGRDRYRQHVNAVDFAPFRLGVTTTALIELLTEAGFGVREVQVVSHRRTHRSGADVVTFVESSTFGNYLHHVPERVREEARRDLAEAFEGLRERDGIPLRLHTVYAVAEKQAGSR